MKNDGFNFGDILINGYASYDNPTRQGIFVRQTSKGIELTNGLGIFWVTANDNDKLKKIGNALKK